MSCEARSCHAHRHNYLEGDSNFLSTIYSFSILCLEVGTSLLWRSTVAFTYLKVKSTKCLYLLPVVLVLVLRIWSCLHHWPLSRTTCKLIPESSFWILLELRITEVVVTAGSIRRAKLPSNNPHQQTDTQLSMGRMPFMSPNQQCQSTEGKKLHIPRTCSPQAHLGFRGLPSLS